MRHVEYRTLSSGNMFMNIAVPKRSRSDAAFSHINLILRDKQGTQVANAVSTCSIS